MMNQEIKAEWLRRLRDGRPQTQGVLNRLAELEEFPSSNEVIVRPVGQCCLGVLCEIAEEAGIVQSRADDQGGGDWVVRYSHDLNSFSFGSTTTLPEEVVEWAGLDSVAPEVNMSLVGQPGSDFDFQSSLDALNDSGVTFPQIADVIEYYL